MKCVGSSSTSSTGAVVRFFRYIQPIPVSVVSAAVIQRKRTACHKVNLCALSADINGARNILAVGHAVLACGGMVQSGHPLKQEPAEVIQAPV